MILHTCPVLAFTPETEAALALFRHTHGVTAAGFGAAWFEERALPAEGSVEQQPAKLMQALAWLESVHNDVLRARLKERTPKGEAADV